jgi:hypothetical protein
MDAPYRAPADRRDVFDLSELLESVPGVFYNTLLPALEPRHHAALALTCSTMRDAVQQHASKLTLLANRCCMSREHQLGPHFPNLRAAVVKPGNLHEAMFVVPLFLMQVRGLVRRRAWGGGAVEMQLQTERSFQRVCLHACGYACTCFC